MDYQNKVVFLDIDGVVNTLIIDTKPFKTERGQVSRDGFYYKLNIERRGDNRSINL